MRAAGACHDAARRMVEADRPVMIGFLAEDDAPVALLPARGSYHLFDPLTGPTKRLDPSSPVASARSPTPSTGHFRVTPARSARLHVPCCPSSAATVDARLARSIAALITLITPLVTASSQQGAPERSTRVAVGDLGVLVRAT